MNSLHKLQHEFLDYLLDDSELSIVEHVVSTPERSAEQRLQLYGNAYRLRLKEALSTDYERLHAYLGDELFDTLLEQYINHHPSKYPSLRDFGTHMVEFVSTMEPFSQWPEVAELARIEQAFGNCFDAADDESVTLQQLETLAPAEWTTLTLRFNDSVQLLSQGFNSFQIWQALSREQLPPEKITDESGWLVWRQDRVSRYRSVEPEEQDALTIAMTSGRFVDICEVLLKHFGEQETPRRALGFLQQWIHDQMVGGLSS